MENVIQQLKQSLNNFSNRTGNKVYYLPALSENDIIWIEKYWNIHLPKHFKVFLSSLGGVDVLATEIGLLQDYLKEELDSQEQIKEGFSMLSSTDQAIKNPNLNFPQGFIKFEFVDDGGYYVLDCRTPEAEDSPIYVWEEAENYLDDKPIFSSFKDRLESLITWINSK